MPGRSQQALIHVEVALLRNVVFTTTVNDALVLFIITELKKNIFACNVQH